MADEDFDISTRAAKIRAIIRDLFKWDEVDLTTSEPLTFLQKWNNAATTFVGFVVDITITAAHNASRLFAVNSDGVQRFWVGRHSSSPTSGMVIGVYSSGGTFSLVTTGNTATLGSDNNHNITLCGYVTAFRSNVGSALGLGTLTGNTAQVMLYADGDGILSLRKTTTAQEARIYNTTDGTNMEYFRLTWKKTSNRLTLETVAAGTGVVRDLDITAGVTRITNNTASSSTTTGALVLSGGLGITGAINASGGITGANISTSGSMFVAAAGKFEFNNRGSLRATANGVFVLVDIAGTSFGSLEVSEIKSKVRYITVTTDFELNATNCGQDVIIRVDSASDVTFTIAAAQPVGSRWQIRQVNTGAAVGNPGANTFNGPYWKTAGQWTSMSVDSPSAGVFESEGAIAS